MDQVNFPCSQCGKSITVAAESLGQLVCCPHCQQTVLAPMSIPPVPPPEPASSVDFTSPTAPPEDLPQTRINIPNVAELESIFASPESSSDALFGPPPQGLLDMPTEVVSSSPQPPPSAGSMEATLTYHAPDAVNPRLRTGSSTEPDASAFSLGPPSGAAEPSSTMIDTNVLAEAIPKPQIRPPVDRGGWLIALLVVPLISYSILATIAVIYLRFFQAPPAMPHPLETIPDEGENPGAKHVGTKMIIFQDQRQEKELPRHLRTVLHEPIRIGDLEVTPVSVERRYIEFIVPGYDPARSDKQCLALNLHLKNVSKNSAFRPLDPYFVRHWQEIPGESKAGMPFTFLTVGKTRFYGGPITLAEREEHHESIRGQRLDRELRPGDEMDTFICTNPEDAVLEAVEKTARPMLWRVQVRRGFVRTPNRGEVSATAVVGVEFTRDDIRKGG